MTKDITATNGRIDNLLGDLANFKTVISNELITAKGWMLESSIGDAQISSLSANKLRAGTIDTALVTIASKDSTIEITGNQMLVNDTTDPLNSMNRVIVGKYTDNDGNTEYGLLVRSVDGQTVMIDGSGVHNAGITDGAVDNNKVADDANISGKKLDINSVVTEINGGETKISQTIVQVGDKSLEIVLGEQTQKIEEIETKRMLRLEIRSTNGNIFKNGDIETQLYAIVYNWDEDITDTLDENQYIWTRKSKDTEADTKWNNAHFGGARSITVTTEDVSARATFYCDLIDTATRMSLLSK